MRSFLVTSKMSPPLAARIEASVRGRTTRQTRVARMTSAGGTGLTGPTGQRFSPPKLRIPPVVRLSLAVLLLGVGSTTFLRHVRSERSDLEAARASLLADLTTQTRSLTADDRTARERAELWIGRAIGSYEGDVFDPDILPTGALATKVARSTVYLRAPLRAFDDPVSRDAAVAESTRDPLLLCLIDPPAARDERSVLERVRVAYPSSAPAGTHFGDVHPLHDLVIGVPVMAPGFEANVQAATDLDQMTKLRHEFDRAKLPNAIEAAKARTLLLAIDEPGDTAGPTELDDERAHTVRIELVDLTAAKVLLRLRRRVDPGWISPQKRVEFASGLDGCALAMDVTDAVTERTISRTSPNPP